MPPGWLTALNTGGRFVTTIAGTSKARGSLMSAHGVIRQFSGANNPSCPATVEGEATALYVQRQLVPHRLTVTRIARGLPVGGDLEYADGVTIAQAQAVDSLLREQQTRVRATMRESQPRLREIARETESRIRTVLSTEQWNRWQELRRERTSRRRRASGS